MGQLSAILKGRPYQYKNLQNTIYKHSFISLQDNPNERPTAKQIENHPSIPKYLQTHPILDPHMVCKQLRKLNPPERANHETVANNAAAFAKAHELKNMINEE